PCDCVHGERDAGEEELKTPCELLSIASLDDEVDVIGLDGELNDPHAASYRLPDLRQHRLEDAFCTQARRVPPSPNRHVNRMPLVMRRTPDVGNEAQPFRPRPRPRLASATATSPLGTVER